MAHAIALTSTKKYFEPNERAYAAISPFFCISKDCLYELPFSVKTLVNKCISNAVVNHVHNDT